MDLSFSDSQLDVNDDGRFNSNDLAELGSILGEEVDEYTSWDFNQNHYVDQSDYDTMSNIIQAGLGSGILGDYNRDGLADLSDYQMSCGSFADITLSDCDSYHIELDSDLNGVVDYADLLEIRHVIIGSSQEGDIDGDSDVDSEDLGALLATLYLDPSDPIYNPAADLNADCSIDNMDLGILLANYPTP